MRTGIFKTVQQVLIATVAATALTPALAATVSTEVDFESQIVVQARVDDIRPDFQARTPLNDVFPKLDSVQQVAGEAYLYTLKPIGKAGIEHVTSYAADYTYSESSDSLTMSWTAIPGLGNADLDGQLKFKQLPDQQVRITLRITGELSAIDVPFLVAPVAPSVTRTLFEENAQQYLNNLANRYGRQQVAENQP